MLDFVAVVEGVVIVGRKRRRLSRQITFSPSPLPRAAFAALTLPAEPFQCGGNVPVDLVERVFQSVPDT